MNYMYYNIRLDETCNFETHGNYVTLRNGGRCGCNFVASGENCFYCKCMCQIVSVSFKSGNNAIGIVIQKCLVPELRYTIFFQTQL